ncbi:hypothetical protein KY366_06455 [Candidatus Woesearchaeota archaeon]|nr:hypothetical protein [Candidatus Woesearchaeota archaeon]
MQKIKYFSLGIFVSIAILTVILLGVTYPNFFSDFSGLFTFLSVIIAISVFFYNEYRKKELHKRKQINTLKNLLVELDFIAGEDMAPGGIYRKSILEWYKDSFKEGKLPTHHVGDINVHYYLHELDPIIKGKNTVELKKILLFIHYKVYILNTMYDRLLDQKFNLSDSPKDKEKMNGAMRLSEESRKGALKNLEKLSKKAIEIIKKDFKVKND